MSNFITRYFTEARTKWAKDVAERVAWTAAEVVLSYVVVSSIGLPEWAVMPATAGLAWLKGVVAKHVGDPTSAAITPVE